MRQTGNTEIACGRLRDINDSSADERTAVSNPYYCPPSIFLVVDMDQRPKWQRPICGSKILGNCIFSTRGCFANA